MKKQDLLRIYLDGEGKPVAKISDMQKAVISAAGLSERSIAKGDFKPMNILLAIIAQILADDTSGELEKQFQKNLVQSVSAIRENRRKAYRP